MAECGSAAYAQRVLEAARPAADRARNGSRSARGKQRCLACWAKACRFPRSPRGCSSGQSTAKTYVARLYEKLGAGNRAQALMTAIHYGLIRYSGTASYDGTLPMGTALSGHSAPGRGARADVSGDATGIEPVTQPGRLHGCTMPWC